MTDGTLSKWEQAIDKLVKYTQDNKLNWRVVNPGEYVPNEKTTDAMLLVEHNGRQLLLYRKAYIAIIPSGGILGITGAGTTETRYRVELVFYDPDNKVVLYRFPYSELSEDLYKAAVFNAAGVQEFLDDLLDEVAT